MTNKSNTVVEQDFVPEIKVETNPVAIALNAIHSESFQEECGGFNIEPRLKVSYSICASTPTVEMQKEAIAKFSEFISVERDEDGIVNFLHDSFQLENCIINKDTISFIGKIGKYHESFGTIQESLRFNWEKASMDAGIKSESENRGMEIILN